ncbi:hypothetical protein B0A48_00002 [Cryoendolithus antarcticus]|uniref:Uncharacterized protein n=1 Tax=Cryoendolithus antarcticus TaxID=1507870 RepID=A0A1V8TTH7_9PEZI|nr:hypothetical protein B0A48_00002 [Cryoendolithus antarcticus]
MTEYYTIGQDTTTRRNELSAQSGESGMDAILLLLLCIVIVAGVVLLLALLWFGFKYLMNLPRPTSFPNPQECRWRDRIRYGMHVLIGDIRARRASGLPIDPLDIVSEKPPWSISLRIALPTLQPHIAYPNSQCQTTSPFFMRLPAELRVLIYEQVIYNELASSTALRINNNALIAPAIAQTCKALSDEVRPVQLRLADETDCIVSWMVPYLTPNCLLALLATLKEYQEVLLRDLWPGDQALRPPGRFKLVQVKGFGVDIQLSKWGMVLLRTRWTPVAGPVRTLGGFDNLYWSCDVQDLGVEVDHVSAWQVKNVGRARGLWRAWSKTSLARNLCDWWTGALRTQVAAARDGEDKESVQTRSCGRPGSERPERMTICLGVRRRRKATWADIQAV